MAHRRKSSHPVCKTRRNLGSSWDILKCPGTEEDHDEEQDEISKALEGSQDKTVTLETEGEAGSGQQIMIPPDLYKDFEAVRSQTKMDTTDLMRRLLKDYQSLATTGVKTSAPDDPSDADYQQSSSLLATKASIASDVSLATTRVDDEDEFQGLDLTVKPSRKIDSRLFDTKSLNSCDSYDQPLDLTCTKPTSLTDASNRESPSSSQIDLTSVNNEFNYVYVYPGLYPPNSGILGQEDIRCESPPKEETSPVPELMSPNRVPSPEPSSRSHYVPSNMSIEPSFGLMNPSMAYHSLMSSMTKGPLSPVGPPESPQSASSFTSIKPVKSEVDSGRGHTKQYRRPGAGRGRGGGDKGGKMKEKKPPEMKVISETTTYPGVYTSVMKLPWSRRTRTKKPKHKVKLEDTLVPQFMLEQSQLEHGATDQTATVVNPDPVASNPDTSNSVMMVYPNATSSSFGKPMRKRGRPPKLPMLAKLLQHQQAAKRSKKKENGAVPAEMVHQSVTAAPANMMVYSAGGPQLMPGFSPMALPLTSSATDQPGQPTIIPNMSQAQLIGQFPLSQITGGPIQFLGQFPAMQLQSPDGTLHPIQPLQMPLQEASAQTAVPVEVKSEDQKGQLTVSPSNPAAAGNLSYQYTIQPMLIPASVQSQLPVQQSTEAPDDTKEEDPPPSGPDQATSVSQVTEATEGGSIVPAQVVTNEETKTLGTMSTTSLANTGSGAIYQEMILSSKSLVDVKKRKRQTAIQLLKAKSNDQNFLCTSFRIRPRLVAQAQAQRERLAAKGSEAAECMEEFDTHPKNLNGPQNDSENHFGEKGVNSENGDIDFSAIQIKREIDETEMYGSLTEYGVVSEQFSLKGNPLGVMSDPETETTAFTIKQEPLDESENKNVVMKPLSSKRFMLRGSQKRKAKGYRNRGIQDIRRISKEAQSDGETQSDGADVKENEFLSTPNEMFQELFNCKICNKIIPVDQMETHSLEHLQKKLVYKCENCGSQFENVIDTENGEPPNCTICHGTLTKEDPQVFTRYGHGKIACDECPEAFKSLPEFYEHKTEVHKNENSLQGDFECDFCGKMFQFYHALQFHRRTHRERRIPCLDKTCTTRFRSRKEMELHFDAKHPDKKEYFHCVYEGCSKKFLKNFHLQEHIRVKHYNIKAFQCPWPGCIKEFAAQRHLKIHLLIHRDEKPMKCDHCDYRCRQRSAMNWHMRKHPDVPYKYKRSAKSPSVSATESE